MASNSTRSDGRREARVVLGVSAADAQAVPIHLCEMNLVAPRLAFDGDTELPCEGLQRPSIDVPAHDAPIGSNIDESRYGDQRKARSRRCGMPKVRSRRQWRELRRWREGWKVALFRPASRTMFGPRVAHCRDWRPMVGARRLDGPRRPPLRGPGRLRSLVRRSRC